jgi:hypothetical protein
VGGAKREGEAAMSSERGDPKLNYAGPLVDDLGKFLQADADPAATVTSAPELVKKLLRLQRHLNRWVAEASAGSEPRAQKPRLYAPPDAEAA